MIRWLVPAVLLLLSPAPALAQDLKGVGSEASVGANATGETCRIRVVQEETAKGPQRLNLYCDGWTVPSGTLFRFRVSAEATAERLLTDSQFQKGYETRLGGCSPVETTTLGDGTAAGLRQCTRLERGWPVVVMAAVSRGRGIALETFPTNVRVLEPAIGALSGKPVPGATRDGSQSAAARRAETIVGASGKLVGIQDIGAAETLWRLGRLQYRSGNYAAAEVTFGRLLEIHDRVLGSGQPGRGPILSELALTIGHQSRFDEADRVFAQAEKAAETSFAEESLILFAYRSSVHRDNKPVEALAWAEQAVRIGERSGEISRGRSYTVGMHALALRSNNRHAEAEAAALNSLRMASQPGNDPEWRLWWVGEMHALLGRIHREQQRFADARREWGLGLARRELLFGESSGRVIEAHAALGLTEQQAGDLPAALKHYRRAAELQIKHRTALEGARLPNVIGYLDVLSRTADAQPGERQALAAEMFTALQIPRGSETAKALRAMSARVGSGDPKLAALSRELQDLGRRRTSLRVAVAEESTRPPAEQRETREEDLKRQLRETEDRIDTLEQQLQAEFPRYARLTAERPLPADEVRALLQPDEALIAMQPAGQGTFVVIVRRDGLHYYRARIGRGALDTEIKALRGSLDLTAGDNRAFDVARARRLYDLLLAPGAAALAGVRHLLTVPAGPLMSFPLGILVVKDAPAGGDYRTVPFLANDVGISVLPSVAALRDLRAVAARSTAPQPFIGFADPAFAGGGGDRRNVADLANLCRQGETLDPALLRGLPRLRESADEVKRIAAALGTGSDVVVGADATERKVRDTDLTRYRVVAFATHGLLPGELRCQAEPALALTPPAAPTKGEDGLLDASEVATLKLDADWVVLSACNTAGPDGSLGGESLSGLTRAFFYAGARALLASHWAVASGPTVDLTTAMFRAYAGEAGLGKAEALRRAQSTLRAKAETAHPFFWAPFVLVGDGGATR